MAGLKILIVEDNRSLVDLLEFRLRPFASQVHAVDSVAAAQEWAQVHRPDIALIDYFVPGTDGVLCAEAIHKKSPATYNVLMSANLNVAHLADEHEEFAIFLRKPFLKEDIHNLIVNSSKAA